MKRSEIGALTCALADALAEVGDPWSLLIIQELTLRNRRFDGIAAQTKMSESSLAASLKRLEKVGVVGRRPYQAHPPRYEYRLTSKGADLWSTLVALTGWGDRWQGRQTAPRSLCCTACGAAAHPRLACASCGAALNPRAVNAVPSAGNAGRARHARLVQMMRRARSAGSRRVREGVRKP